MRPNELGRLAFETFTCWKSGRHQPLIGDAMNSWENLPANEKQAWTKAAMVVGAETPDVGMRTVTAHLEEIGRSLREIASDVRNINSKADPR